MEERISVGRRTGQTQAMLQAARALGKDKQVWVIGQTTTAAEQFAHDIGHNARGLGWGKEMFMRLVGNRHPIFVDHHVIEFSAYETFLEMGKLERRNQVLTQALGEIKAVAEEKGEHQILATARRGLREAGL